MDTSSAQQNEWKETGITSSKTSEKLDLRDDLKPKKQSGRWERKKGKIKRVWDYSVAVLATWIRMKIALEFWGKSILNLEFQTQFLGIEQN